MTFESQIQEMKEKISRQQEQIDVLTILQQFSLMQSLGVEISQEQQAEAEVKALYGMEIPVADGAFKTGVKVEKDSEITYNGSTYKCLQTHIMQADWTPDKAASLWQVVKEEFAEFKQPSGAHDAYNKGDKVTFGGKKYESLIDGNTYSPTAYPAGWKLLAL